MQNTLMVRPKGELDPETRQDVRTIIDAADQQMRSDERQVAAPPQVDHFAPGLYARELHMPAGTIISSKIHKLTHFCFVMKGKALVVDEFHGGELIEAPCMIKTKAGTKRILKVLEDSVWITVHATEETDVSKIEQQIVIPEVQP